MKLIEGNEINKYYGKNHVIKDINFLLCKNDAIAIVGGNGSGKTTLLNILSGTDKKYKGQLNLNIKRDDISFQIQSTDYSSNFTLLELMYLFSKDIGRKIPVDEIKNRLAVFSLENHINDYPNTLSGGQLQKFNILLTFASNPKVIFFDELLSGLDQETIKNVIEYIRKEIKEKDISTITVSHNPNEIFNLSKKVFFLKDGVFSGSNLIEDFNNVEELAEKMNNEIIDKHSEFNVNDFIKRKTEYLFDVSSENCIELNNIKKSYKLHNVIKGKNNEGIKLNIKSGEAIAIIGKNGSGKSTLAEIISGTKKQTSGEIKVNIFSRENQNSTESKIEKARTRFNQIEIQLNETNKDAPKFEKVYKSFNRAKSIFESINLEKHKLSWSKNRASFTSIQFQKQFYPSTLNLRDIIIFTLKNNFIKYDENYIDLLLGVVGLDQMKYRKSHELSGGERQKFNVILALAKQPKVLIFDELTTGLDISAKKIIIKLIKDYIAAMKPILIIITHSIDDINQLANRVIKLSNGKIKSDMNVKFDMNLILEELHE